MTTVDDRRWATWLRWAYGVTRFDSTRAKASDIWRFLGRTVEPDYRTTMARTELVWIDDWEMQCCGEPFSVGDSVDWPASPLSDGSWCAELGLEKAPSWIYSAHCDDEGQLRGTVEEIEAVFCRFRVVRREATRIPRYRRSGTADARRQLRASRRLGWTQELDWLSRSVEHRLGCGVGPDPSLGQARGRPRPQIANELRKTGRNGPPPTDMATRETPVQTQLAESKPPEKRQVTVLRPGVERRTCSGPDARKSL